VLWERVSAITEVSVPARTTPLLGGEGRSLIGLALIWWACSAFVWAVDAHDPSSPALEGGARSQAKPQANSKRSGLSNL